MGASINRAWWGVSNGQFIDRRYRAVCSYFLHHLHEASRSGIQGVPWGWSIVDLAPLPRLDILWGCKASGFAKADEPSM